MKTKHILILYLTLFGINSFGHEQIVHEAITVNAAESAFDNSPGYADFLNTVSSDLPSSGVKSGTNSMRIGSFDEDFASKEDSVGGNRSYNHFYDPLDQTYHKGLSDSPPDERIVTGTNSFVWASISNCAGYNFPGITSAGVTWSLPGVTLSGGVSWSPGIGRNENTTNVWSWQNARGYEWLGLTAANKFDRQTNLLHMFRAVGQVMHLLEDASQPQHVRNEQHLNVFKANSFGERHDPWASPIEIYGREHVNQLNYRHDMLDWRGDGFTKLEDFWDRHLYNGASAQPLVDGERNVPLGLAEWCNGNFLGDRHQYAEYSNPGKIDYYPYPSLESSTDYLSKRKHLLSGMRASFLKNGLQISRLYLDKIGDGVAFSNHSVLTYFGAEFANVGIERVSTSIRDDNVLQAYHDQLIPKAVKYSAGLLDYFFRGTLGVSVASDGSGNYTLTIRNTSGQDYNGGSFMVYEDDSFGGRSQVDQFVCGKLPSLGATNVASSALNVALSGASSTTKFTLIYQGNIGMNSGGSPLDPVDAGIGIAAKNFTIDSTSGNNCGGNPASIQGLNWRPGVPGYGGTFTSAGASLNFSGGLNYLTADLTNSGDCDVTISISAHFVYQTGGIFWFGPTYEHFGYGNANWYADGSGTADPQFILSIPAHSVYHVILIMEGISGNFTFDY